MAARIHDRNILKDCNETNSPGAPDAVASNEKADVVCGAL